MIIVPRSRKQTLEGKFSSKIIERGEFIDDLEKASYHWNICCGVF